MRIVKVKITNVCCTLLVSSICLLLSTQVFANELSTLEEHLIGRDRSGNYRFYIIDKVNPQKDKPLFTTSGDMFFKFQYSKKSTHGTKYKFFAFQEARTADEVYDLIKQSRDGKNICFFLRDKVAVHTITKTEAGTELVVPRTLLWLITVPQKLCPEDVTQTTVSKTSTIQHYTSMDADSFFYNETTRFSGNERQLIDDIEKQITAQSSEAGDIEEEEEE